MPCAMACCTMPAPCCGLHPTVPCLNTQRREPRQPVPSSAFCNLAMLTMEHWLVQRSPGPSPLPGEASRAGNTAAVRQCDGEAMPTQDGMVPTHGGVVPTCACMAGMGVGGVAATTLHQVSCEQDPTAFPYSTALLCICCDLAHLVLRGFVSGQHAMASCCIQHPTW